MNNGALRAVKKLYIRLCAARDRLVEISSPPSCPNYITTNCSQHIQHIQEGNNVCNGIHSGNPLCHCGKPSRAAVTSAGACYVCATGDCDNLQISGALPPGNS